MLDGYMLVTSRIIVTKKEGILVILVGIFLFLMLFLHLHTGVVMIELGERPLSAVVNLSCFGPLRPDMRRSDVHKALGEPYRVHVIDNDGDGQIDYQEIRWEYICHDGVLAYYVEEYDTPGGTVEYVPQHMRVQDFFLIPVHFGFGKHFVRVRDSKRTLLTVNLRKEGLIRKVNWHCAP